MKIKILRGLTSPPLENQNARTSRKRGTPNARFRPKGGTTNMGTLIAVAIENDFHLKSRGGGGFVSPVPRLSQIGKVAGNSRDRKSHQKLRDPARRYIPQGLTLPN